MLGSGHYYRRHWNESRGDEYDDWGEATYYFEVGKDGYVVRQMELYAGGAVLKYDPQHSEDEFGGLAETSLEVEEYFPFKIPAEEFETRWERAVPINRPDLMPPVVDGSQLQAIELSEENANG